MRDVHPELVAIRGETTRHFSSSDELMQRIVQRLDTMNTQVWGLRDDLPEMLAKALGRPSQREPE